MESAANIVVHDIYMVVLWDTNYFEPRPDDKRICGRRVADGLFSIEAYATNSRPEHRLAHALAARVVPAIQQKIKECEADLRQAHKVLGSELGASWVAGVKIDKPETKEWQLGIPKGRATPTAASFLRLFLIMDEITANLKTLHHKGALTRSEYKTRENMYAKPLRKLMHDLNVLNKEFHTQRRALGGQNAGAAAATTEAQSA